MRDFLIFLALVCLGVAALLLVLQPRVKIVNQGQRVVIYHLGQYRRMSGPGLVWWWGRVQKIERSLDTVMRPHAVNVPVFVNGIALDLTLNMWYSTDPLLVTRDAERLTYLTQFTDGQRHSQAEAEICARLPLLIGQLLQGRPTPSDTFERLLPVIPGTPLSMELLRRLEQELAEPFRKSGITLDRDHPPAILRLAPPEYVIENLKRGVNIEALRKQLPDLSEEQFAHMVASIHGLEGLNVQELLIKGDTGVAGGIRQRLPSGDGTVDVMLNPPSQAPSRAQVSTRPAEPLPVEAPRWDSGNGSGQPQPGLTRRDVEVLKRVPRSGRRHRSAA